MMIILKVPFHPFNEEVSWKGSEDAKQRRD